MSNAVVTRSPLPEPDLSLVRDYRHVDDYAVIPPSVTHYHKDNKDLFYVAASHGPDVANPTHETIRRAIQACKPQILIIEGTPTGQGLSPERNLEYIKQAAADGFRHVDEPVYAGYLAQQQHIPFAGGEPAMADIYATMKADGYSARDVMAHHLLRLIPELRRGGTLDASHFDQQAARILQSDGDPYFDYIPKDQRISVADFKAWYAAHDTSGKSYLAVMTDDTSPYADANATYFQAMSHTIDKIRDRHLNQIIAGALKGADRVMVVYGNAHLYTSRPVLEKMFGSKGVVMEIPPGNAPPAAIGPRPAPKPEAVAPDSMPGPARRDDTIARNFRTAGIVLASLAGATAVAVSCIAYTVVLSFPLTLALATAAAVCFGGSVIAEVLTPSAPPATAMPSSSAGESVPSLQPEPAVQRSRSDGKSWTEAAFRSSPSSATITR